MPAQPQTFHLNLYDTTRTARLAALLLLGVFTLMGVSIWAAVQLGWLAGLLVAGGGGYAGWRAFRQAAVVPAVVTLTPTELRLDDLRPTPRLSQTLPLADITTYRHSSYNGNQELRLNRADAPPLKRRTPGTFAPDGDFAGLLAAFEQTIEQAPPPPGVATREQTMEQAPTPPGVATRREKSFFEKPISTYLLVVYTLLLGGVWFQVITHRQPFRGNYLTLLALYLAYVAAWRAAAARRNAP